jgi:Putative adhesin
MARHRNFRLPLVLFTAVAVMAGCNSGPSVSGAFDRSYVVTGPIRLELNNASGDVDITGSADGKVHVRGEVRASGFGFDDPQKRLDDTLANPPIEQKGDTIRIGKDMSRMRHISIAYTIQVPHDTEITTNVASGAQTVRSVTGPVTVRAASGSIRLEKVERDAELTTASGTISANNLGNDLHVTTASGNVNVSNVKGDVRANAVSGVIRIANPGARVDASDTSGEVEIQGASNDVKAHAISGLVSVQGNPSAGSYWDLKTVSGGVQLRVPTTANFHFSAEAASGEIRTDVPIVVEEQGKHSLRAHMGNGGGRVEVHTVSGEIRVSSTK